MRTRCFFKHLVEFLSLQAMFPPKHYDQLEGLDAFRFFFKHNLFTGTLFLFYVDSAVRNDSTARKKHTPATY